MTSVCLLFRVGDNVFLENLRNVVMYIFFFPGEIRRYGVNSCLFVYGEGVRGYGVSCYLCSCEALQVVRIFFVCVYESIGSMLIAFLCLLFL